jgi:flagellar assembly factor FliW
MTAINRSSLAVRHDAPADSSAPATDVVAFASGLPGFEACRGFVLIAAEQGGVHYLTSVEGPAASFLAIDPRRVQPGYRCQLSEADRHALRVTDDTSLLWLALVTVEADGTVAVNLRAPVVINPDQMLGQQVIPYESLYPLRHVLLKG